MPLGEVNYFLFVVGMESIKHPHESGDCGVGRTSIQSGISDCRWGTMLIAPQAFVENRAIEEDRALASLTPSLIKRYVLEFFGHVTLSNHFAKQRKIEEPDTQLIRRDHNRKVETWDT